MPRPRACGHHGPAEHFASDCPICRKAADHAAYMRRYRQDPERYARQLESNRRCWAAHAEEYGTITRKWIADHRDDRRAYLRGYYARHRDAEIERLRAWREAHPEARRQHVAKTIARLLKANPNYLRQKTAKRRAVVRAATVGQVDYDAILQRDGWYCHICGMAISPDAPPHTPLALDFDHVVPVSKGGAHSMENIKPAHVRCNRRKSNHMPL